MSAKCWWAIKERKYIKIDICAPEWFHFKHGAHVYERSGVYKNDGNDRNHPYRLSIVNSWCALEEYFADIAKIYQEEIRHLYNIGLSTCHILSRIQNSATWLIIGNLQIDDPLLTFFCDENITSGMRKEGIDPDALFKSYINLLKNCLVGRPIDMNIGIHLCRGNNQVRPVERFLYGCCQSVGRICIRGIWSNCFQSFDGSSGWLFLCASFTCSISVRISALIN